MKSNISAGTIARTVILFLALINQCLALAGISPIPIADEQITTVISTVWTAAAVWAWWKNNSFTQAALEGDKVMRQLKEG